MHFEDLRLPPALTSRPAIRLRWLGTAGFEIEHDGYVVLIDPYLTRAPLRRLLARRGLEPDAAAVRRHIGRADAIIVGHTHFDHVLDVPLIARATGATVYGSRSAVALCAAAGVAPDQLIDVEPVLGREVTLTAGPFELRLFPSAHGPLLLGRVPLPGDIPQGVRLPLPVWGYRCGAVLGVVLRAAGRTIAHLGSAQFLAGCCSAAEVDLLLLGISGWQAAPGWIDRASGCLRPKTVLLSHWDSFFQPLERRAQPLPGLGLAALAAELSRQPSRPRLGTLPLLGELWL